MEDGFEEFKGRDDAVIQAGYQDVGVVGDDLGEVGGVETIGMNEGCRGATAEVEL